MEGELFQGGVLMHSYLRAVGFSRITKRSSIRQIITDVVETYDEKTVIENYPDGMFAEFSKNYGCDCGITGRVSEAFFFFSFVFRMPYARLPRSRRLWCRR